MAYSWNRLAYSLAIVGINITNNNRGMSLAAILLTRELVLVGLIYTILTRATLEFRCLYLHSRQSKHSAVMSSHQYRILWVVTLIKILVNHSSTHSLSHTTGNCICVPDQISYIDSTVDTPSFEAMQSRYRSSSILPAFQLVLVLLKATWLLNFW